MKFGLKGLRIIRPLCFGIIFIALSGCLTGYKSADSRVSSVARVSLLEDAVESFADLLKWGYFDELSQYQRTKGGVEVDFSLGSIGQYRVVSYENLSKLLSQDGITARVVSEIEYYEIDTGLLSTKFFDQRWWYDGVRDRWYITSSIPSLIIPD